MLHGHSVGGETLSGVYFRFINEKPAASTSAGFPSHREKCMLLRIWTTLQGWTIVVCSSRLAITVRG